MGLSRWRVQVFGRVQGVFFRKYAQMTARSLGLGGWVRNEPDGSVLAEIEGPPEKLELFVQWAHRGSPSAQVRRVEVKKDLPPQGVGEFEIVG